MMRRNQPGPGTQRGLAMVEMALVVTFMIFMVFAVFEVARALYANNLIVNMGREGANLAARSASAPADIMEALASTAAALDMDQNGVIYITRLIGRGGGQAEILEQHRRRIAAYDPPSEIWPDCGTWISGTCSINGNPTTDDPPVALAANEVINAVEIFYDYDIIFTGFVDLEDDLYSMTVF